MDASFPQPARLRWFDYLLLALFCAALYGFSGAYERILNPHETVHCLNVREMLATHDWVIPTYGGRPWLERPPLPHWITALPASLFGAGEQVWTYRLGSHLAGILCVLMTAWMGAVWFGRNMGLLCGAVLATMFEFYLYSTNSESDISLCLIVTTAMTLFVHLEFNLRPAPVWESKGFLGKRPWPLLCFFLCLGLTNMAKGLFFGSFFVTLPVGAYLLGNFVGSSNAGDRGGATPTPHGVGLASSTAGVAWSGLRRYLWLWGWLACAAAAAAWAVAAWLRYPDIVDLWYSDYMGRMNQGYMREPAFYYFVQLPAILAPWLVPALIGLVLTARAALRPGSVARFLWCWAWLPILFFSIPQGKHHHYLLHGVTPWAILAALGARRLWMALTEAPRWIRHPLGPVLLLGAGGDVAMYLLRHKIPGADSLVPAAMVVWPVAVTLLWLGARHAQPAVAFTTVFGALLAFYCLSWVYRTDYLSQYADDTAFIRRTRDTVPADRPIYVKCDLHPLNGSWLLFYLGERTAFLHNLSFLRDANIHDHTIYIVGRLFDEDELKKYGDPALADVSAHTRGQVNERDRYALFRFTYRDDLARVPAATVRITPCQATGRALGPFLGE